jgi:predicted kinase
MIVQPKGQHAQVGDPENGWIFPGISKWKQGCKREIQHPGRREGKKRPGGSWRAATGGLDGALEKQGLSAGRADQLWHVCLFGQDAEEPEHDARHNLIETLLWKIASRALVLGTNVILDFGFWAQEEREDFRLRAKQLGASSEVHFLDVQEEELMRRLAVRNSQDSEESFHIPEQAMKPWIAFFQRPTLDELERRE